MLRTGPFEYEVSARVEYTLDDALFLRARAREHYDAACMEAAEPGPRGIIHGMINVATVFKPEAGAPWRWFTFSELDLLCKILEPAVSYRRGYEEQASRLFFAMKRIMIELRAEWERLNPEQLKPKEKRKP